MQTKSSLPAFIGGMFCAVVLIGLGAYAKETFAYAKTFAKPERQAQVERFLSEAEGP